MNIDINAGGIFQRVCIAVQSLVTWNIYKNIPNLMSSTMKL